MTSFISAGELAQLRADADRTLFDATCTLLTPTAGTNSIGEVALTWGTLGAGVPCRLRPDGQQPAMSIVGGQPQTVAGWKLTLPHGTVTVQPGDRAVVSGVTYEIKQVWAAESWRTATRVDVVRIEV
jgi:hypothetical protein